MPDVAALLSIYESAENDAKPRKNTASGKSVDRGIKKCVDLPIFRFVSKISVFPGFCGVFYALASTRQTANMSSASTIGTPKQSENGVSRTQFLCPSHAILLSLARHFS